METISKKIDKLCEENNIKTIDRIGRLERLIVILIEDNKRLREGLKKL